MVVQADDRYIIIIIVTVMLIVSQLSEQIALNMLSIFMFSLF